MNSRPIRSASWVYPTAAVLSLALLIGGAVLAHKQHEWALLAAGSIALIATLIAWPMATSLHAIRLDAAAHIEDKFTPISDRLEQFSVMLTLMSEQQLLSDRAKSVAFREKEREALRRAIQEEIARGEFEAAGALAADMEEAFGLKEEADRYRQDITNRKADIVRRQINDVMAVIDRHCRAEQWQQAQREADKLAQQFPNDEQARNASADIERRREAHKQQLIQAFRDANTRNDTDGSIEIVKQMDSYLSPSEAEAYQEQVRGVFKDKLNSLRTKFADAVHDQHWTDAVRVGETIMNDFPNTQMAKEVREKMEALRKRAGQTEPVRV